RTLANALHGAGHELLEVEQGTAALAALQAADGPRIALLALDMPDMDGLQRCRRVRRLEPESTHRYLILVAGKDAPRDDAAGFLAGADDVICVMVADEALRARIERARRALELHDERA